MSEIRRNQWNKVAMDYQSVFKLGLNDYNRRFLEYLTENEMIREGGRVLDIGCGVGKYGTVFAEMGLDVTLIDISDRMLEYARKNMEKYSTPWKICRYDFNTVTGNEEIFKNGFDLTISTFSPAIHDGESLRKMSGMTHGWCFVSRFESRKQPFRERLFRELGITEVEKTKENDSMTSEEMAAFLERCGYYPTVQYVPYNWEDKRTPEEMAAYLLRRDFNENVNKEILRDEIIRYCEKHADEDGYILDDVQTMAAWISWNTEEIIEIRELFETAGLFHGHKCPGLAMGVRAAYEGLKYFGTAKNEHDLYSILEHNACYTDGVQAVMGTTLGRKAIEIRETGATAFNFYDRNTGKQIRFLYCAEFPEGMSKQEKIDAILTAPLEKVYRITGASFELTNK